MSNIRKCKQRIKGSIAPVFTPFKEDESIDLETFNSLIN